MVTFQGFMMTFQRFVMTFQGFMMAFQGFKVSFQSLFMTLWIPRLEGLESWGGEAGKSALSGIFLNNRHQNMASECQIFEESVKMKAV